MFTIDDSGIAPKPTVLVTALTNGDCFIHDAKYYQVYKNVSDPTASCYNFSAKNVEEVSRSAPVVRIDATLTLAYPV